MKSILILFCLNFICSISLLSQDIRINEIMSSNKHSLADSDGDFVDWIELYNASDFPVLLEGYYLSDDREIPHKWLIPTVTIEAHDFLLIYASGKDGLILDPFHTNFKLKSDGEELLLTNAENERVDSLEAIHLASDKTYGRLLDGESSLYFLSNPTPGASNNTEMAISQISFSRASGFYKAPFYLKLNCSDSIYYTLDGSTPDTSSFLYTDSIHIASDFPNQICLIPTTSTDIEGEFGFQTPNVNVRKAVVLKVAAYSGGVQSSSTYSKTYFTKGDLYTFPVVSISTDRENLFADENGIYVPGETINADNIYSTGNYNQRGAEWEKNVTFELFNEDGMSEFSEQVGLRIAGSRSRNGPQKSLRIYFREEYGLSNTDYPFFKERETVDYKRLILRSPFSYWWKRNTLFQDDIIHEIIRRSGSNLDIQVSRPAVVFINGEYWGVQNLRERQDQHYLSYLHNVNKDSVDIVEGNLIPMQGNAESLSDLIDFIDNHNLSNSDNFNFVSSKIDISNFIDYFVFETYFGNQDWPGNNVKLWKSQHEDGKWRFLLYDMDAAIGDPDSDPFDFPDPNRRIVKIFNGLCQNDEFKSDFVSRYVYLLNSCMDPTSIRQLFYQYKTRYAPEIPEHIERWGNPNNYQLWEESCRYFMDFMEARPCIIKQLLIQHFDLENLNDFNCLYEESVDFARVFPNPGNGNLNLVFETTDDIAGSAALYTANGALVFTQPLTNSNHQLFDLTFLESGVYLLRVSCNGETETKKVIIQH